MDDQFERNKKSSKRLIIFLAYACSPLKPRNYFRSPFSNQFVTLLLPGLIDITDPASSSSSSTKSSVITESSPFQRRQRLTRKEWSKEEGLFFFLVIFQEAKAATLFPYHHIPKKVFF